MQIEQGRTMKNRTSRLRQAVSCVGGLALLWALTACDSLSDVGEQDSPPPKAVFTAVGYTSGDLQDGSFEADVRTGAEVLLSGRGSDFQTLPIVSYRIEPINDAARAVPFTVRSADAIAVVIPPSTLDDQPLRYRLTVTDGGGLSSTAQATLNVVPALDSDRFLKYQRRSAAFTLVTATDTPRTAVGGFELRLKSRITYSALDRSRRTVEFDLLAGDDRQLTSCTAPATLGNDELAVRSGQWRGGPDPLDAQGNAVVVPPENDYRNPRFVFPVPEFNADDITRLYQANLRDPELDDLIGCLPDPGRVDQAEIEVQAILSAPTLQSGARLYLAEQRNGQALLPPAINDGIGTPTLLRIDADTVETLRIVGGGIENKDTARSYYAAIDPLSRKTTLEDWLVLNCFDPEAEDYGADAHAVYTNNFDLGFGRDMYMRTRPCQADGADTARTAAVVVNYPTAEGAAKRVGAFLAVAMEYLENPDPTQPGRVTFYTFAPDPSAADRQGGFVRVLSANFDGRGEKYVPGSCTTCHGGAPALPDLEDPLQTYAGTDPDVGATFMPWDLQSFLFVDSPEAPAIVPEPGVNDTLRLQLTRSAQEAEFRKLNQGAYQTYGHRGVNDIFTCFEQFAGPCELIEKWYAGADLPSPVFIEDSADNVPEGWNGTEADIALYNDVFARHCRACHVQRVFETSVSGSDPQFSSVSSFLQAPELHSTVFGNGSMPGARLTSDRLWQSLEGQAAAGALLATAMGEDPARRPGQALACVEGLDQTGANAAQRNQVLSLSAACSEFADGLRWQLLTVPAGSDARLAGDTTLQAAFVPDRPGNYRLALDVTAAGGNSQDRAEYLIQVPDPVPQAAAALDVVLVVDTPTPVDVLAQAVSPGDRPSRVEIRSVSGAVAVDVGADQVPVLRAGALDAGEVRYAIVDVDGDTGEGLIRYTTVADALVGNPVFATVATNSVGDLVGGTNTIDLSQAVAGAGPGVALDIQVLQTPSLPGAGGTQGLTVVAADCAAATQADPCRVAYTPPPATTSVFQGRRVGADDSFVYRACRLDAPTICADGTVTVSIEGQSGFAPVAAAMVASPGSAGCNASGCHGPADSPDPSWMIASTADEKQAWCSLREGNQGFKAGTNEGGALLVVPGDFLASLMFSKPQVLVPHRGSVTAGDADLYQAIADWISEGGYYTGAVGRDTIDGQSCP